MLEAPPSYFDVISEDNLSRFCHKCGFELLDHPTQQQCGSCGQTLIINIQPQYLSQPPPKVPFPQSVMHVPPVVDQPTTTNSSQPAENTGDLEVKMYIVEDNRIIFDFEKVPCCPFNNVGIDERVFDSVPRPLKDKGITLTQWKSWMEDLMKVQKKSPSVTGCWCLFCFPGLIVQSCLCATFCPISMSHPLDCLPCFYGDWYTGLKNWMKQTNAVLNPLHMHAKLVTYKQNAPRSVLYEERRTGTAETEISFLVIALTKTASEKLMAESWNHGVRDGCTSDIGRIL